MQQFGHELLESLVDAPWEIAVRTFGSSHATLIGLLVHWWISGSPESRTVMESGPSFGYRTRKEGGRGQCDAIFCEHGKVVGVLEVEGSRPEYAAEKLGKFFAAEYDALKSLKFAILCVYSTTFNGRGATRKMTPAVDQQMLQEVVDVSQAYPDKAMIVVALDKVYERQAEGIRARNEWYFGNPNEIKGILYNGGQEIAQQSFYGPAQQ